jgi:hypothetical protein
MGTKLETPKPISMKIDTCENGFNITTHDENEYGHDKQNKEYVFHKRASLLKFIDQYFCSEEEKDDSA